MLTGGRHQAATAEFARAATLLAMATLVLCAHALGTAGATASAAPTHGAGGIGSWPWPVVGEVVGEYRNGSDPYAAGQHRGVDIAAPAGTPARAVVAGMVSFSGKLPDGGQTVTIRSADGQYLVSYLHLSRRVASRGSHVAVGETVGLTGTTGRRSTAQPHLHLGVRVAATRKYVDPMSLLGAQRLAEPVRAPVSEAPAESRSKPSTQRVGGEKLARIEPLEQPRASGSNSADVAAPPVTAIDERVSAGKKPRHGSNESVSIEAPPPVDEKPTEAETAVADRRPIEESAESRVDTRRPDRSSAIPLRPLLLALTALALAGLFFNRRARPSEVLPTEPLPTATAVEPAEAQADRPLLRSVK